MRDVNIELYPAELHPAGVPALSRLGRMVGRIPAAPVLVPLAVGAVAGTWARPYVLIGPFTRALGPADALGWVSLMLFCIGVQVRPSALPRVGARVAVVLAGSTLVPGVLVIVYGLSAGAEGVDGVSLLAACTAAICTSNAVWMALATKYGTGDDVAGGMVAAAANSGPALPLVFLGLWGAGGTALPLDAVTDALLPLFLGFGAGLLVQGLRERTAPLLPVLLPIMAFSLGWQLDLRSLGADLLGGVVLGVGVAVVTGGLTAAGWSLVLGQPPVVGWAAGGITVGAVIVPRVVAGAEPTWAPYAASATAQVAVAVIVSSVVAAALTAASAHRHRHKASTVDGSTVDGVRGVGRAAIAVGAPQAHGRV